MTAAIFVLGFAGVLTIIGLLIAECVAERRHQKWMRDRGYNIGRKRS